MEKEYEYFLQADLSGYIGNWIVIVDDKIVASGKDIKELYAEVKKRYPNKRPLLSRIPDKETMIL